MAADVATPLQQAVVELDLADMTLAEILSEFDDEVQIIGVSGECVRLAAAAGPPTIRAMAGIAALIGMAIGVRAERIRQRRDGDHPSERPA